jgi:hypothetical protein
MRQALKAAAFSVLRLRWVATGCIFVLQAVHKLKNKQKTLKYD